MAVPAMKRYEFTDFAVWADTVNQSTPCPAFLLVFDEDPTFDGEPESVGEEEKTIVAAVPYGV